MSVIRVFYYGYSTSKSQLWYVGSYNQGAFWCDYSSSDDHTFPSPENLKIFFNLLGHLYLPPTPLVLSPLPLYSVLGNEGYVNYWKLFGFPCNVRERALHLLEAPLWFFFVSSWEYSWFSACLPTSFPGFSPTRVGQNPGNESACLHGGREPQVVEVTRLSMAYICGQK